MDELPISIIPEYIVPGNYLEARNKFDSLTNGQKDSVVLFGSTHLKAMWRKDAGFITKLGKNADRAFNPQVDDWDPSYKKIEGEAMAEAGTILVRLENKDIKNGSLGSFAEAGAAALSGILRGQKVIISFEENFNDSIGGNDISAVNQVYFVDRMISQLAEKYKGRIIRHDGDNLEELAQLVNDSMQAQRDEPLEGISAKKFADFVKQRDFVNANAKKVYSAGSAASFYKDQKTSLFQDYWESLKKYGSNKAGDKGYKEAYLGENAARWNAVWGDIEKMKEEQDIEWKEKEVADELIVSILGQGETKAGTAEVFYNIINSLETGNPLDLLFESVNPVEQLHAMYEAVEIDPQLEARANANDVEARKEVLSKLGVEKDALDKIIRIDIGSAYDQFLKTKYNWQSQTLKAIKKTLLKETAQFWQAENTMRVRELVGEHLERILADAKFSGLISVFSNNREDFLRQLNSRLERIKEEEAPTIDIGLDRDKLPKIQESDRLVPKDFKYGREEIEEEFIRAVDHEPVFEGYPEVGLKMTEVEYEEWVKAGRPIEKLIGVPGARASYFVGNHTNRLDENGILRSRVQPYDGTQNYPPGLFGDLDTASDGSPLNPFFKAIVTKSRRGIPTGPGFYWKNGKNKAADPVFLRVEDGKLEGLLVFREDGGGWALPGGMVDDKDPGLAKSQAINAVATTLVEARNKPVEESGEEAAEREAGEEAGIRNLNEVYRVPILIDTPVGDWRGTAQAFPTTSVYLFIPNQATAKAMIPMGGDDAKVADFKSIGGEVKWGGIDSKLLFASHESYLKLAILEWERQTGFVVGRDGTIGVAA